MDTFALAFRSVRLQHRLTPGLLHDPRDRVVETYPPLADYDCYAVQYAPGHIPAGTRPISCSESVLTLAMVKVWEDKNRDKPRVETISTLLTESPNGLTMHQMLRRLQRLSLEKFPVCEYDRRVEEFRLIHGEQRSDKWAICFIPADDQVNPPFEAHWTFTTVVPIEAQAMPRLRAPVVIFSRLPVLDQEKCFWRARVEPGNKTIYDNQAAQGCACDCDWRLICQHERAFISDMGAQGLEVMRTTLAGELVVEGTYRAQVLNGTGQCKVLKGAHGRVRVISKGGAEVKENFSHSSTCLKRIGMFQNMKAALRSDKSAVCTLAHDIDVFPYRLQLWEYEDFNQCAKSLWYKKAAAGMVSVASKAFGDPSRPRFVAHVEVEEPPLEWACDQDLTLQLPRRDELLRRLATRGELDRNNVMDVVRRLANEERWNIDMERAEFHDWLDRTVTSVGTTAMVPAQRTDVCHTCLQKRKMYRNMCKVCTRKSREERPEPIIGLDSLVVYVGNRPLWSKHFVIPAMDLKADVEIYDKYLGKFLLKEKLGMTVSQLVRRFKVHEGDQSCRGYLRGPMFLGLEPSCFPRGEGVAAQAFLVRLGVARLHEAQEWFFDLAFQIMLPHLHSIDRESWDEFIAHFRGEKRMKNLLARRDILDGWQPLLEPDGTLLVKMTGFPKAEKSNSDSTGDMYVVTTKDTEKPRFICSPDPIFLASIGPYTHAQTKWLSHKFHHKKRMYYAGCSTPDELNEWLNMTISEIPEPWTLADDITAMDSNHSAESFKYHKRMRDIQFPRIPAWIEAAYVGEETVVVRVGRYRFKVGDVNASGVPDTSYKNSAMCLPVRLIAIAHGYKDLLEMDSGDQVAFIMEVLGYIYSAASGDDGLTRLPDVVCGIHTMYFSIERYNQAWAWAGFSVKTVLVPPNRWRMATFLAMRPVWSGARYEWAAEPARRLKNMFWQIDNPMHGGAWARGVASQVLSHSGHCYVLEKICTWFLNNTSGPKAEVDTINPYSPFYGMKTSGSMNERSLQEFKVDYHVYDSDIQVFEAMLASSKAVLVNFDCQLLRRVFAEES